MLFSADFYKTTEEAKEQMWQYFQSPQEYETNDEGSLTILHKVELTDKDMEYLQTKTGSLKQQKICMGFSLKTSTGPEMVESIRK